jgi:hypothetical protein
VDFVLPSNIQRLISAKLSFKRRAGWAGGSGYNPYKFAVKLSADVAGVNELVLALVPFNSVLFDPAGGFNTTTSQYTTPVSGYWSFASTVSAFNPGSSNMFIMQTDLFVGGVVSQYGVTSFWTPNSSPGGISILLPLASTVSVILFLVAGQVVEIHVNKSTANSNLLAAQSGFGGQLSSMDAPATAPLPGAIAIALDGTDITAAVGGPFSADQYELNLTQQLGPNPTAALHTLQLTAGTGFGSLSGILRLTYYVNGQIP